MPFVSRYPDIHVPDVAPGDFVLAAASRHLETHALADVISHSTLTYVELLDRVRCTAAGLAELGLRKGEVAAFWLPNRAEFAIVFHAVLKLGAIVTPANPAYTTDELVFQLKDAQARLLVTTSAFAARARAAIEASGQPIQLITIDKDSAMSHCHRNG